MSFPLPYVSTLQKLVAIHLLEEEIFRFLSLSRDLMWAGGQGNMWRHGRIHVTISHQLAKFHGQRSCQRGYVTLLVCHMITIPHHVVRGSCDSIGGFLSPYVPNLLCLVVIDLAEEEMLSSQFVTGLHLITWSEGHYGWVSLIINHHSDKFVGHWLCKRGYILLLICHVTSCDHVVRGSSDIMGELTSL